MNKKIFLIPILALTLAACAPKGATTTTPSRPEGQVQESGAAITIQNFTFTPNEIKVKAGQTVSFTNKDLAGHSLTSDDGKSFDTGVVGQNQDVVFSAPAVSGTYPFHCTPHPGIKGTLIVE